MPRRFEFQERLGEGATGEVYRAILTGASGDVRTPVAVKILKPEAVHDARWRRRLRDEARNLAALDHPNIPRVVDLLELGGYDALVTEYVEGADLSELMRTRPRMPARALYTAVSMAAEALHVAYAGDGAHGGPLRIVHRDVKPSNLRIGRHAQVKLVDFGIAVGDLERSSHTDSGNVVGSLAYMAPERFEGHDGPASDVFSLGAVLFEGIAGFRFHEEGSSAELVGRMAVGERYARYLQQRLERAGDLPWDATDLLVRMLAFEPERRPDARTVARRLEEIADHTEGPSLRVWCQDRGWTAPVARGRFSGQVLEEPRTQPPPPVREEPVPPAPRRGPGIARVAVGSGVVAMLAGVAGLGIGLALAVAFRTAFG